MKYKLIDFVIRNTGLIQFVLIASLLAGYITNAYKLITTNAVITEWTVIEIMRVVGLLVPPVGAIMGIV